MVIRIDVGNVMKKKIILLGASGNIGLQTLDVIKQQSDSFEIIGVSVGKDPDNILLSECCFLSSQVRYICTAEEREDLYKYYPECQFVHGEEGLIELTSQKADLIVNALAGLVGLMPTLNAIRCGTDIALANKEILVACGSFVMKEARENGVRIIPIDSEHSAIAQCILGYDHSVIENLIITASGGSFRDLSREQLSDVTLEMALNHPNWRMGKKITVDCATMMNKGFEIIEAHWLFDIDYDHIKTILHPQSIVHSLVEFKDHAILAQMGVSDMRMPIQFALNYPERHENNSEPLDLVKVGSLNFRELSTERYPLVELAYKTGRKGGNMPAIMNGANERAVCLFLQEKISFPDIERLIFETVRNAEYIENPEISDIIESNNWAQQYVLNHADR